MRNPSEPNTRPDRDSAARSVTARERFVKGRKEAEQAVEKAIVHAEGDDPSEAHLEKVADAIDALEDKTYGDATEVAEETLRHPLTDPQQETESVKDLRSKFERLKSRPYPKG